MKKPFPRGRKFEVTKEIRIAPGRPDQKYCLLYQKLQLLNCCIEARTIRGKRDWGVAEDSDSLDEEFYEVDGDEDHQLQPSGRLKKHDTLKLLKSNRPLFIPRTQEPPPLTEDQMEEYEDRLLELSSNEGASEERTNFMSMTLASDMEAFKAANPGCVLADFIRWFSPADWIEAKDDEETGHLSDRMTIRGNTWETTWADARPVPARLQRRLFDDTKEMEQTLIFLENHPFYSMLLPVYIACILHALEEREKHLAILKMTHHLDRFANRAKTITRAASVEAAALDDLGSEIYAIEERYAFFVYLLEKFTQGLDKAKHAEVEHFLANVCSLGYPEVEVPGGPRSTIGNVLKSIICSKGYEWAPTSAGTTECFPVPSLKEMIIRSETNKGPQRLFASLSRNEIRLCGAFSKFDY